jgi:hypothetical protein
MGPKKSRKKSVKAPRYPSSKALEEFTADLFKKFGLDFVEHKRLPTSQALVIRLIFTVSTLKL